MFYLPPEVSQFIENSAYMTFFWVVMAILFLLIELGTPGLFFFVAFAVGSCVAAVLAFVGVSLIWQCTVGLACAGIAFWVLKKIFAETAAHDAAQTNTRALIGVQAVVTETIDHLRPGRAKVRGEEWVAQVREDIVLQKGTIVQVVSVEGNRVTVKKYHKEDKEHSTK